MNRPKVVTCNMVSVDGRLTIAPGVQLLFGDERWSAIAGSSDPYQWVRDIHDPDLLLEGSNSFGTCLAGPPLWVVGDVDSWWRAVVGPE